MSDERRDAIAEIARRHGLTVVEDDVYGFQHPAPAAPLVSRLPDQCCYVTSASKVLGPGMRVGYAMLPEHLVEAARAAIRATCWMTAPLNAEIVSRWIEDGGADDLIAWHREEAGRRAEMAYQALAGLPFRHQTGAYHMWLDLPPPWRVDELVDAAAGRGVRLIPPDPFLVGRGHRPHGVRLSSDRRPAATWHAVSTSSPASSPRRRAPRRPSSEDGRPVRRVVRDPDRVAVVEGPCPWPYPGRCGSLR